MDIKTYLTETTVSGNVDTLDKKIGEEPIVKFQFNVKTDISNFIKKFKKGIDVMVTFNPVTKDGVVSGVKSNVDVFMKKIKTM